MHFRTYDGLYVFNQVAQHGSFTAAAEHLNLTKGAISYQINRLEEDLQYAVFTRTRRGIKLTERGEYLLRVAQHAFRDIEREVSRGRSTDASQLTIGLSTYFASRWLSSRLMRFMTAHPNIRLRIHPMIDPFHMADENIDMAIRWGHGGWTDVKIDKIFTCPAFPTAGAAIMEDIRKHGVKKMLRRAPLLHDREDSKAWKEWHRLADIPYRPTSSDLVISDPNVRVQAVIDGQGLALNDALIANELSSGSLTPVSNVTLARYGYHLAYPPGALDNPSLVIFRDWIIAEAQAYAATVSATSQEFLPQQS